ncbi:SDR family NAD(P)-dependent oxidoreductase [Anaerocolumna jejuensis]|uniref:SDR family NAD(P)-dependent oxidoreductase n=1 Tax=Anaerocolumna jejuensis TaxID=259063 RepID=UPI003F7CA118
MIVDVSNKVVVITGASKGIGSELARTFAKENSKVVINYNHSEEKAHQLFNEISEFNENCMLIKADITNPSDVSNMYHEVVSKYGSVDILINNAGVCDDNLIQMMSLEQWKRVIDINLTGCFLCSREFSKIMIKQKFGKIINIASLKGQEGCVGQVNYTASKAGLISFTKSLAKELGRYNIAVNAICPGFIVTDLNRHNEKKKVVAQERSLLAIDNSLGDLIKYILFISSDNISSISGQVFNLDSRAK